MLCVANTDWEFVKVNHKFEQILGYTAEELEGKSFVTLVHQDDLSSSLNAMRELEGQKSVNHFVNRVLCRDGSYRYLEWKSQPNGNFIYASARDITEKCLKEMSLIQLTEELQQKNEILKTLAVTDELTGIYNRHYIDKVINREMSHSDKNHEPLTMVLLDLDHFKIVNDQWGHPVGDEVLKHTARLTKELIRKSDIIARFGGEEFVVLLPNTTLQGGLIVSEKIRKKMETSFFSPVGTVTASFGVSERKQFESFQDWYKRADEALYYAKNNGRNRVIASEFENHIPLIPINIRWNKEWECGHKGIDHQHHELVKQGARLIQLSLAKADQNQIINQIDIVLHSIIDHFKDEEQILLGLGYPDVQNHAAIHRELVQKALQLKDSYKNKNKNIESASFFTFIVEDIIIGHMLESDTEYYQYIRS
ncbi:diguanylate cyclase [Niallia sp. Krafla_26]|uniref:diguanylate cyclase n=1 Tax=Niallia sp. Krafla_26 TaxID=3064703 RepID=UPI003D175442